MSVNSSPNLTLSTWNLAANNQADRVGTLAAYLTMQGPGATILTELTATDALKKALTREIGNDYSLDDINTGGTRYEDGIGLLVIGDGYEMPEGVEAVPTHGDKMRYIMRAGLTTPLGQVGVVGLRGAYISGRGTRFSSGGPERKAQFQTAAEVALDLAEEYDGMALLGGDTNSFARTHDRIFTRNGLHRLSGGDNTWPDRKGLKLTTLDSRIMAAPHALTHQGIALDAIYGTRAVQLVGTPQIDATGISDHMHVEVTVKKAV